MNPGQPGSNPNNSHYPSWGAGRHPIPVQHQPPNKTVGLIATIVACCLLLAGAIGAYVMFFGDRDEASSSPRVAAAAAPSDDVLRQEVEALRAAIATGQSSLVEEPLLELAILPDHALAWSTETFGPSVGAAVYSEWERDVFKELPALIRPFREGAAQGRTAVRIVRLDGPEPTSSDYVKNMFANMVVKRPLYRVELVSPTDPILSTDIEYFAVVNGRFGYVGDLVSAWDPPGGRI
jgi:hypothetical protein